MRLVYGRRAEARAISGGRGGLDSLLSEGTNNTRLRVRRLCLVSIGSGIVAGERLVLTFVVFLLLRLHFRSAKHVCNGVLGLHNSAAGVGVSCAHCVNLIYNRLLDCSSLHAATTDPSFSFLMKRMNYCDSFSFKEKLNFLKNSVINCCMYGRGKTSLSVICSQIVSHNCVLVFYLGPNAKDFSFCAVGGHCIFATIWVEIY